MDNNPEHLASLVIKKSWNILSSQEQAEIDRMTNDNEHLKKLYEELTDKEWLNKTITELYEIDTTEPWKKICTAIGYREPATVSWIPWKKIFRAIGYRKPVPDTRLSWKKLAIAAAVVGVISLLIFFGTRTTVPDASGIPTTQQETSGSAEAKVILTLADGKEIPIDNKENGVIAKQDHVRIHLSGNRLSYTSDQDSKAGLQELVYHTLTTRTGGAITLVLPDSSRVWLNAASSIRYPVAFNGSDRAVILTGEAYFEVSRNERKPFRILNSRENYKVEVLGTSFVVKAYPSENISTSLLEGKVKVFFNNHREILIPGQQVSTDSTGGLQVVNNINTNKAIAWKNGSFHFSGDDIKTIMEQVKRWYPVTVTYKGYIPETAYSTVIPRSKTIKEVVDDLNNTPGQKIKLELKNNHITISASK